jgi:hypothetical protein
MKRLFIGGPANGKETERDDLAETCIVPGEQGDVQYKTVYLTTRKVAFSALKDENDNRGGQAGWDVFVDGKHVCEVDSDEMDVADEALSPLWEALGIEIKFDYDLE